MEWTSDKSYEVEKKGGRFQTSSKQLTFCFQRIDFGQRIDSVSTHPLTPFGAPPLKTVAPLGHTPAEYDLRTVLVAASPWLLMMSDFFVGFYVYTYIYSHIFIYTYSYSYSYSCVYTHIISFLLGFRIRYFWLLPKIKKKKSLASQAAPPKAKSPHRSTRKAKASRKAIGDRAFPPA